ncbi:MAG: YiiD C-terminal domain-containing protein [Syntrophales bacterium]
MAISDEYRELVYYLEKAIKIIEKMGMRILDFKKQSVKIMLPKEPNINHIGTVYAGSLFSLADFAAGVLFYSAFDIRKYYPVLKELTITFKRPVTTDITVETLLTPEQAEGIKKIADETGKADWTLNLEAKDEQGNVCCIARANLQMRRL